jgi:hypothetical protein
MSFHRNRVVTVWKERQKYSRDGGRVDLKNRCGPNVNSYRTWCTRPNRAGMTSIDSLIRCVLCFDGTFISPLRKGSAQRIEVFVAENGNASKMPHVLYLVHEAHDFLSTKSITGSDLILSIPHHAPHLLQVNLPLLWSAIPYILPPCLSAAAAAAAATATPPVSCIRPVCLPPPPNLVSRQLCWHSIPSISRADPTVHPPKV